MATDSDSSTRQQQQCTAATSAALLATLVQFMVHRLRSYVVKCSRLPLHRDCALRASALSSSSSLLNLIPDCHFIQERNLTVVGMQVSDCLSWRLTRAQSVQHCICAVQYCKVPYRPPMSRSCVEHKETHLATGGEAWIHLCCTFCLHNPMLHYKLACGAGVTR